jgi:hypothetical protein
MNKRIQATGCGPDGGAGISGGVTGGIVSGSFSGSISGSFSGHVRGSGSGVGVVSGFLPGTGTSFGFFGLSFFTTLYLKILCRPMNCFFT